MNTQAIWTALPQIGVIAAALAGSYFLYGWTADTRSEDVEILQNARRLRRQAYQRALDEISAADAETFPLLANASTTDTFRSLETLATVEDWNLDTVLIQS